MGVLPTFPAGGLHERSLLHYKSYCGCTKALLPLTTTHCGSERWRRLAGGMRRLYLAFTGKDLIPVYKLKWLSMMIPLDWKASCKKPTEFPSVCPHATPPKPPTNLSCPAWVPQYQSRCMLTPPGSPLLNVLAVSRQGCAFTALRWIITSGPAQSDPHVLRPCPRRLGLLGQFHIPGPIESSPSAPETSCPGAPSRDHPGKTARTGSPTLKLKIGTLHEEEITFLVLEGSTVDIILGRPWLVLHSPEIRWDSCEVTCWSEHCHRNCLTSLPLRSQDLTQLKLHLPLSKALNLGRRSRSHLITWCSRITAFSTAPILHHPDPDIAFVVEVDASTTGVEAVLSQHYSEPPRLQPCAYYSKKLTPAEQNYDISNWELLAIKLALEEWRHCPFNGTLTRTFEPTLLPNLLRWEAQKGKRMCPLPNDNPFWAQFTMYRALDNQAANGPSRSSKLSTGGPV
ncbi:uncharacterized protein [Sinocyclocheilus grahami]|uniref:uncharacterized protein n=1 Tax=Sinocyclocheilus grahami TaxID=75366 RepID=UPI0007AC663E|nr:PREDICTED: uncharacterized protein LOC107555396 [Sinocyclocheilus grahami]